LVWGDLLAATLMQRRGFTQAGFAFNHPAGSLGAKLMKVGELMHKDVPEVGPGAPLVEVLRVMSAGRLGMTSVQTEGRLAGVITDGDLRRALERCEAAGRNPLTVTASDLLTAQPRTTTPDTLAVEAVAFMEDRKITFLLVMDGERPAGVFHLHDYLGLGVKDWRETLGSKVD
jgi:arabinose-5-phosphate isomerase